jgi:hypothetical protein
MTSVLYLAGPMTGMEDLNYPAFAEAEYQLKRRRFTVRSPHRVDELFPLLYSTPADHHGVKAMTRTGEDCDMCAERTWEWYMGKTLAMLLKCEGVALLDGWQQSRGALLEVAVADHLKMPVLSFGAWMQAGPSDD